MNKNIDYKLINKHNVKIASLRNQISASKDIDELTMIANKIIDLENEIMLEKNGELKKLEKVKTEAEEKVDTIKRKLKQAEYDLQYIQTTIDSKTNSYKKQLQQKIDNLETDLDCAMKSII